MKKNFKFALAILTLGFSAAAYADKGKPGKVHWNTEEEVSGLLKDGNTVCEGSNWIFTCYNLSTFTGELQVQYVSRQRKGVGVNITSVRYVKATVEGYVERDETGNILTTLSKTAAVENGQARIYSVLSAAFNGLGAGILSPFACDLAGACDSGGGPTAISISDAISGSGSSASVNGCGNACTPAQTTPH